MPKFTKIVKPPIGKTRILPQNEIDPNKDYYFCGFYPAWGFQDRQQAGNISEQLYNSIINGKKPIILKWNNSESTITWADGVTDETATDTSLFQRNFTVGDCFVGRVESRNDGMNFATRDSGKATIQGDPINFKEQEIQRRIIVNAQPDYFTNPDTSEISIYKQRLFFICEELAGGDVLYIEDMEVKFDSNRQIDYLRLTFASLADKLKTVGATIDGHVRFSQPGAGYAFPRIAPNQKNNDTNFYDLDKEDIPNTKRVYISASRLKDDGVFGIAIEFDGAVALNSIQVFGRPVVAPDENNPNLRKFDRLQPIFLQTDEINTNFERGRFNTSEVAKYQVVSGAVFHENWFTNWREEYGFFFDPLKKRSSHSVLKVLSDNENVSGDTVNIVETKDDPNTWMKMYGRYGLQLNQWSDYYLEPTKDEVTTKDWQVTFNGDNFTSSTDSVATFLNTQAIWNFCDDYLEVGGIRSKNRKGHFIAVANDIASWSGGIIGSIVGTVAGGGIGAVAGGAIGTQATKILGAITNWIPDRNFTDQTIYRPGVLKSFLVPQNMIIDFGNKVGDFNNEISESLVPEFRTSKQKNIPLELFADSNDNFLSGVVNTKTYKCNFRFKLTDKFQLLSKNNSGSAVVGEEMDAKIWMNGLYGFNGNQKFYTDQSIRGLEPHDQDHAFHGFIIEDLKIKGLTKQPLKVSFYDENGYVLWETSRLTQAGYNGNIFDWQTTIDFSNINDDNDLFLNENYRYPDFEPKTVEETIITNATKKQLASDAKARLKQRTSITMVKKSTSDVLESWVADVSGRGRWISTQLDFGLTDPSVPIPQTVSQVYYDLPGDVIAELKLIYWEDLTAIDTLEKKMNILRKSPYNFGYARIYDIVEWRSEFDLEVGTGSGTSYCQRDVEYRVAYNEPQKVPYWTVGIPAPGGVASKTVLGKNQFLPIGEYTDARTKRFRYEYDSYNFVLGYCSSPVSRHLDLKWRFDWAGSHKTIYKIDLSVDSDKMYIRANTQGMRIFFHLVDRGGATGYQEAFGKRIRVDSVRLVKRA